MNDLCHSKVVSLDLKRSMSAMVQSEEAPMAASLRRRNTFITFIGLFRANERPQRGARWNDKSGGELRLQVD